MTGHIVAGIGFSGRADVDEVVGLITSALADAGYAAADLNTIVSIERRAASGLAQAAAARLNAKVAFLDHQDFAAPPRSSARSGAALRFLGIESVAEAAAGHFGPLVAARRQSAHATCALSCVQEAAS